jgi:hypothetical protein
LPKFDLKFQNREFFGVGVTGFQNSGLMIIEKFYLIQSQGGVDFSRPAVHETRSSSSFHPASRLPLQAGEAGEVIEEEEEEEEEEADD